MTADRIVEAARRYGSVLDQACASACERMWRRDGYSDFEVREGYEELWKLSGGEDLAYDRPSIGLHYALWYHLQRTHLLVRGLIPLLTGRGGSWTIYDIGCGTGATAWATAVIIQAGRDSRVAIPRVRVYGWDTSPFMIGAADRLWSALPVKLRSHFTPINKLGSWDNRQPDGAFAHSEELVVCSYLLNASDHLHLRELDAGLTRFSDLVGAERLLLLSPRKKAELADALQNRNWSSHPQFTPQPRDVWTGKPRRVARLRDSLLRSLEIQSPPPSWSPRSSPDYRLLIRTPHELYPILSQWAELNDEQNRAAKPSRRLAALIGPAGSGKSVVLVERIVRLIESARRHEPAPLILVTSFNKRMVAQLIQWTRERICFSNTVFIDAEEGILDNGDWIVRARNDCGVTATVRFLNRDKLPTRVWRRPPANLKLFEESPILPRFVAEGYSDEFLKSELELIVYGLEVMNHENYIDPNKTPRPGRRHPLRREQRIQMWPHLIAEAQFEKNPFLYRRMVAWCWNRSALTSGVRIPLQSDFKGLTHVFVDEVQDMTRADIRLLAHTPPIPQQLFVTGDSAQALRTHGISPRPHINGARWEVLKLAGSYRLPALVCAALEGLANYVLDDQVSRRAGGHGAVPHVSRAATPGPRPIIVNGTDLNSIGEAMKMMRGFVGRSDRSEHTWSIVDEVSSASTLCASLDVDKGGTSVQRCSMLEYKGLELPLVLFPTDVRPPLACGDAVPEWVYTALTRARGVLMIAVFPEATSEPVAKALRSLDRDHLMFWDEEASHAWTVMTET